MTSTAATRNRLTTTDRPLRVIHLVKHCSHANGSVNVAVDLACMQASAGYEVIFASAGGTFVKMLEQQGVRHITLLQDQKKPVAAVRSAIRLVTLCKSFRPDIIHAHMMGGAAIGYVASVMTGVPLVTTVHNSYDPHSIIMRLGHRVVAVSKAERQNLIKRGYYPKRVVAVWNAPNKSPREAFMQNTREFTLSNPCITVICALHRRKGVFDILMACRSLFSEFPDWRLYIAGEGPDRVALEAQAAEAGLSDRVTFLEFVPCPQTLYKQSDIFVLASYADPGSLSIGEARAAGCVIVATAVGGTPEMLDNGAAGRLVSPGSPKELERELRALMKDPDARSALSAAAIRGSEVFDVRRLVGDYERVYKDARGEPQPRAAEAVAYSV